MTMYCLSPAQYAQKILRLSQHMSDMSYKQDWHACMELEEQRQKVMADLFNHPDMPMALAEIADTLEQVLLIDSESLYMCEEARAKELASLKENKSRQKAAIAYHVHQS